MSGNLHHQPQQHAGKAQRVRPQLPRPTLGLSDDFGMQPHPYIAQHQRHAHKQQTQGRFTTAGLNACLMRLPVGRRNAKTTAIGGANSMPGPMCKPPGGVKPKITRPVSMLGILMPPAPALDGGIALHMPVVLAYAGRQAVVRSCTPLARA